MGSACNHIGHSGAGVNISSTDVWSDARQILLAAVEYSFVGKILFLFDIAKSS